MPNPDPSPETRFTPGNPGGPGRPKGVSLVTLLKRKLAEPGPDGRAQAESIVDAWITEAASGDIRHIKEIVERTDGKVPDKHQHDFRNATDDDIRSRIVALLGRVAGAAGGSGAPGPEDRPAGE